MGKKKLDVDDLKVESFVTRGDMSRRGTVNAQGWTDWNETYGDDCWDTVTDCPSQAVRSDCTDCQGSVPGSCPPCTRAVDCQWA